MELQNQICSDCGTSGSFSEGDAKEEENLIRMAEDPEFAKKVIKYEKKEWQRIRRVLIAIPIYYLVGVFFVMIGDIYYSSEHKIIWRISGIATAIIIHRIARYIKDASISNYIKNDSKKKDHTSLK